MKGSYKNANIDKIQDVHCEAKFVVEVYNKFGLN